MDYNIEYGEDKVLRSLNSSYNNSVKMGANLYNSNEGLGLSAISANKSQTSGHNGLSPTGLHPLFHPEVCDLFANTLLKPSPLLLY